MSRRITIHPFLALAAIIAIIAMLAYSIFGGHQRRDILGTWTPANDPTAPGFQCGKQGLAASVRNSTVQYTNWELSKKRLLLTGKRFDNGRVYSITDTLLIKRLNSSALSVSFKGKTMHYKKTN